MELSRPVSFHKHGALLLMLAAALVFAAAFAAIQSEDSDAAKSGKCGENLTWTLDDDGNLSMAGLGDMNDYRIDMGNRSSAPWPSSSIKTISMDGNLRSIGSYAFYNCSSLESVSISDSVTLIGYSAFEGCVSLESVVIPDSVKTI